MEVVELSKLYWVVGALIVMNFGAIVSIFVGVGRAVWFMSKIDSRISQNTKDINAAHKRIRSLEMEE